MEKRKKSAKSSFSGPLMPTMPNFPGNMMPSMPQIPNEIMCDPQLLKQVYQQMKIYHKYQEDMFVWYAKYCSIYMRRKGQGCRQPCNYESSSSYSCCEVSEDQEANNSSAEWESSRY